MSVQTWGAQGHIGPVYMSITLYLWPELGIFFSSGPSYVDITMSLMFATFRFTLAGYDNTDPYLLADDE